MSEEKKIAFIIKEPSEVVSDVKREVKEIKGRVEIFKDEKPQKTTPYEKEHKLEKLGLMITVVNEGQANAIINLTHGVNSATSFTTHGEGTAENNVYDVLGIGDKRKQIVFSTIKKKDWPTMAKLLNERFSVSKAAKGISFLLGIDAVGTVSVYKFLTDRRMEIKDNDKENVPMNKSNYEVIFAIVNNGYTDLVMNAAKKAGARGGTIINGHGTGNKDIEKFYGIVISPEKQIVMILVSKEIRDSVLNAIATDVGINSKGQGIAFSVPADAVVGIATPEDDNAAPEEENH